MPKIIKMISSEKMQFLDKMDPVPIGWLWFDFSLRGIRSPGSESSG
jgi:hypothetical protein